MEKTNSSKHIKNSEGFSSFLQEYVKTSVIENDQLFDSYIGNKKKHDSNNQFDFLKIKEFLQNRLNLEDNKLKNLDLKEIIMRNKRGRFSSSRFSESNNWVSQENLQDVKENSGNQQQGNDNAQQQQQSQNDGNQNQPQNNQQQNNNQNNQNPDQQQGENNNQQNNNQNKQQDDKQNQKK